MEWWTSKLGTQLTWIDDVRKSTHLVVFFPLCRSFTNRFCLLSLSMCLVSSFKPSKHSNLESASQARTTKNNMLFQPKARYNMYIYIYYNTHIQIYTFKCIVTLGMWEKYQSWVSPTNTDDQVGTWHHWFWDIQRGWTHKPQRAVQPINDIFQDTNDEVLLILNI